MHGATPISGINPSERPEDLLDAMARGDDNLGERLLRMARTAAALDRASILDLLTDDTPAPAHPEPGAPCLDLNRLQASPSTARLQPGEREVGSSRGCDLTVAPAIRRMEVAR
jgi:hypothetical protein